LLVFLLGVGVACVLCLVSRLSRLLLSFLSFEPFHFPFDTLLLRSLYLRGVIVSLGPPNMDNIAKVDASFWRHGGVEDGEEQQQWHEWLDKQVESCRLVLSLGRVFVAWLCLLVLALVFVHVCFLRLRPWSMVHGPSSMVYGLCLGLRLCLGLGSEVL
jgi:hypothetical protein